MAWQTAILSDTVGWLGTLIMQSLWQLQESNSSHCFAPPFWLSSSLWIPLHLPTISHSPSSHPSPLTSLPSTLQQSEDGAWIRKQATRRAELLMMAGYLDNKISTFLPSGEQTLPNKHAAVVVWTNRVCFAASTVNAGSSGLLAAGVHFSCHFVVSDKDMDRANICTVKRLSQPKKASCGGTAAFCRHDRWERRGTLECVHTVEAHTENRARGLLSLYLNSCHQLPRHCVVIEVAIVWYADVSNCLLQFHLTVMLLSTYVMGWNLVDYHNTAIYWWLFLYTPKWAMRIWIKTKKNQYEWRNTV